MITRTNLEQREAQSLQPYACHAVNSRGRRYPETPHRIRTCFQRDRSRVIHSAAFRRLEYKTQVFANHVGDHYRTRLTHSLEVAQIARTIARALQLNEDLVEAISLAHDLGHPPFGHAGEDCLRKLMGEHHGFEHNLQSLRIVDYLDHSYRAHHGLNLTFELRACLWLHSHERKDPEYSDEFGALNQPPLEGQIVDLADSLTYSAHDLEDALRAEIITEDHLADIKLWQDIAHQPALDHSGTKRQYKQRISYLINLLIEDLLEYSSARIAEAAPSSWEDVSAQPHFLIGFSPEMQQKKNQLQDFLFQYFYRHPEVATISETSEKIITGLFKYYLERPHTLPPFYHTIAEEMGSHRVSCDYVAGMTDRFAVEKYRDLIGGHLPFQIF